MDEIKEDDFHKMEKIGEGSFGVVYKGRKKYEGEICALKYISKFRKEKKELADLRNEISVQRSLSHPNIIKLFESFETKDDIVVVTELAIGELYAVLVDEGGFTEDKVLGIAHQMASALYYLHAHRVLHRDLKPENVLVCKDGVVKLCDFGFARTMGRDSYYAKTIKGTPLYMAPELMEERSYDENVDLWAFACIMYELCAGRPPFCSMSPYVLHKMIVEQPVDWPNNMTSDLRDLLQQMLIKNPTERITWPEILSHPWFDGKIAVSEKDLALPSPYTKPDLAREMQKTLYKQTEGQSKDVTDGSVIMLDRVKLCEIEEE